MRRFMLCGRTRCLVYTHGLYLAGLCRWRGCCRALYIAHWRASSLGVEVDAPDGAAASVEVAAGLGAAAVAAAGPCAALLLLCRSAWLEAAPAVMWLVLGGHGAP